MLAALDLVRTDSQECSDLKAFTYDLLMSGRVNVYFNDDSHLVPVREGERATKYGDSHREKGREDKAGEGEVDINYQTTKDDRAQLAETLIHEGAHVQRADGFRESQHASIASTARNCIRR